MDLFGWLFWIGAAMIAPVLVRILTTRSVSGSPLLAGALLAGFAGLTAVTIAREGVLTVIANHTMNFWGIQVWYDLLIATSLALFFIMPRARAAGMRPLPWVLLVAATASIGLLAMVARLWWLERRAQVA
ncbi:MAG: hypothetical protein KJZ64_08925 [Sphingomonadaceae bacterium]|nr:hypothetical protein [Sphingomonadaceae bacterium]